MQSSRIRARKVLTVWLLLCAGVAGATEVVPLGRHIPVEEGLPCGNGLLDAGEACDVGPPLNLDGENCNTLGFPGGTLACAADCFSFDTTQCLAVPTCGNGSRDPGEVCDDVQLGLQDCESQGYPDGGSLSCLPDCSGFNTDSCLPAAPPPDDCGFQTIFAPNKTTLIWPDPADIDMVRGPLRKVRAYKINELRRDFGVNQISIAADNPADGEGFYYLIKHLTTCPPPAVGPTGLPSWFAPGQSYDRDDLLPDGGCNRPVPDVWTVNDTTQSYTIFNGCTEQAKGGNSLLGAGNGASPQSIAFSTIPGAQGGFAFISQGVFLQVVETATGNLIDQIDVANLIGRPGICEVSGMTCSTDPDCLGGADVCQPAVDLRGIGTSIPQVFQTPGPMELAFVYIAANVRVTPTDTRPWFIVLDQGPALDGAGGLTSHVQDAELQTPNSGGNAEALDVTVISAPHPTDATEFQRAWFSARDGISNQLFARLVATPVGVNPPNWTVRRNVITTNQTDVAPQRLQIGAGDQGELALKPQGDQGTLLDIENAVPATVCDLGGTRVAVEIEGPASGSYISFSLDQQGDTASIVREAQIDGLACAGALTVPVGVAPIAVDVMGQSFQVKAFVANSVSNDVTAFDKHGNDVSTTALPPAHMTPVDIAVQQTPSRSCNVTDIQVGSPEVGFTPVGCNGDEIFMVWCRCTDPSGLTCPIECPYDPAESCPQCEEVGDNPWEELGVGDPVSSPDVPSGGGVEITVTPETREPLP